MTRYLAHPLPRPLRWGVQVLLIIPFPLFFIGVNARLACTKTFLHFEYQRPGFPKDPYGFTLADRMQYGTRGLDYLFNTAGIGYLGQMRFPKTKKPLFNTRELSHMRDVKHLVARLTQLAYPAFVIYLLLLIGLLSITLTRTLALGALWRAGIFTLVALLLGIGSVALAFQRLFLKFHEILGFEPGTFLFYIDDTLIRLYPEQFWMDAFLFVLLGAISGAVLIALGARWWQCRLLARNSMPPVSVV